MSMANSPLQPETTAQASNVVRLATAARRRVDNCRWAAQRKALEAFRDANPWPGEYKSPWARSREASDAEFAKIQRTPEMAAILAILTAFPSDRINSLLAAADLIETKYQDDETARLGAMLVREGAKIRRAAEVIAASADDS
jgi:hypothetical protein